MKYKHRDIKVFKTILNNVNTENIINLNEVGYKKLYNYEKFEQFNEEVIIKNKNIFQEYNKEIYTVYGEISKLLTNACSYYSIDQNRQNYFIRGNIFNYTKKNNNEIFDFPGRDIPVFHGFFILGPNDIHQKYKTDREEQSEHLIKNTLTLSSPTNFINNKVDSNCLVIEYYISPLSCILQSEQNHWIPIL